MKLPSKKLTFSLFFLGNFILFPVAIAEEFKCHSLENLVSEDGAGISFFDLRALTLFRNGQLESGSVKVFLEKNEGKLSAKCLF